MIEPYYEEPGITLYHGDCREVMAELDSDSIDTIITDPPYGLEFMGKDWDKAVPGLDFWSAALRVCKPGAMMLAFGGTRLFHRLTCAIEDAGWEIRDCLMWLYGSGFPKSHDISKAIDKAAGVEFKEKAASGVGFMNAEGKGGYNVTKNQLERSGESTPEAALWDGWGTALKPAWEPIVLAMKPLDGTFAENALKHGVAGLNIDGGRIGTDKYILRGGGGGDGTGWGKKNEINEERTGRFPANIILDAEAGAMLDKQSGELTSGANPERRGSVKFDKVFSGFKGQADCIPHRGADSGGASRFFYVAKPSKSDRGHREDVALPLFGTTDPGFRNTHPTVKPTPLMQRLIILQAYLMTLTATPMGGTILDPFGGSGTTAIAAKKAGRPCIIIERDEENLEIIKERLKQL